MIEGRFNRRSFIAASAFALAAAARRQVRAQATPPLRAAIIGHTGRGNYGHGLDVCWNDLPGVDVVAVADPDEKGRARAAAASKAPRQYADYREMLTKERPNLVSVAPRWTDQHRDMCLAAIDAGAHIYSEKPFTTTLAEADEVLAAAERKHLKIAVAHQMRLAPSILFLKQSIADGLIGDLVQMRAWGKQDARAGGEDMMVLGVHLFDLMRFFSGADADFCTARVTHQGTDITKADARSAGEFIGPIAGDEIEAQFYFPTGVSATFTSRRRLESSAGHWGIEFIGSKASARLLADIWPRIFVRSQPKWTDGGREDSWKPIEGDPSTSLPPAERATGPANRRVVEDLLTSIRENREPACSGRAAMKAIEMVMAVYQAALSGARARLPLDNRRHPLQS